MGTRKSSRRTKPPIKLMDYEMVDLLEDSAISEAVKCELSQVKSMIKDLSPTNSKAKQSTVKQDRTIEDLRISKTLWPLSSNQSLRNLCT